MSENNLLDKNQIPKTKLIRESGIELLRIILMLFVVILHYNGGSGHAMDFSPRYSAAWFYTYFLEAFCVCAVDCFVLISGYFLAYNKKIQMKRIISIMLTVILIYEVGYLINVIFGEVAFSFGSAVKSAFPANYYAFLYLTTYILSPFINLIFDKLQAKRNCGIFVLILLGLFIVYPTLMDLFCSMLKLLKSEAGDISGGISTISGQGNLSGYSIVNFVTVYCIGVYTRRFDIKISKLKSFVLWFFCGALIFLTSIKFTDLSRSYCSVLCVASAWLLFNIFNQMKFSSKVVNYISKGTFGVFCLHAKLAFLFFQQDKIEAACSNGGFIAVLLNSLLCVGLMVVASYIIIVFLLFVCTPPVRGYIVQNSQILNGR